MIAVYNVLYACSWEVGCNLEVHSDVKIVGCAEEMDHPALCPDLVGGGNHCLDVLLPLEVEG